MLKKAAIFIWDILLAFLVGAIALVFNIPFSTALEVSCELQADKTYTCQVNETVLGWSISETQFDQVIDVDRDLNCSGSGKSKGCSARAEFQTPTGDRISLSGRFTDPDHVQKLVNAIKPLMQTRSTPINYTGARSPFLLVSLTSCLTMAFILRAFLKLLPERKAGQPATVISFNWKK